MRVRFQDAMDDASLNSAAQPNSSTTPETFPSPAAANDDKGHTLFRSTSFRFELASAIRDRDAARAENDRLNKEIDVLKGKLKASAEAGESLRCDTLRSTKKCIWIICTVLSPPPWPYLDSLVTRHLSSSFNYNSRRRDSVGYSNTRTDGVSFRDKVVVKNEVKTSIDVHTSPKELCDAILGGSQETSVASASVMKQVVLYEYSDVRACEKNTAHTVDSLRSPLINRLSDLLVAGRRHLPLGGEGRPTDI